MNSNNSPLSRILRLFFIAGIILVIPLVFTRATIEPVLPLRFVLLAALLLGVITFISFRFSPKKSPFDYAILRRAIFPVFLIHLFFAAISLVQGVNFAEGLFDLLKIALYFIFLFTATLLLVQDETMLADLSRAFAILAAALSFMGICQYFGIAFSKLPGNYIVYATMANKNLLSEALFLTFPFLLFGILNFKGAWALLSMIAMMLAGFVIGVWRIPGRPGRRNFNYRGDSVYLRQAVIISGQMENATASPVILRRHPFYPGAAALRAGALYPHHAKRKHE